jgi:Sec-independent protein translocase protein TatA
MSATPPDQSAPTSRDAGRHRGSALPVTLPWRKVGLRSAAGLVLVVGVGAVTLGPARLPDGVATPAAAEAAARTGVSDADQMDAAALSMRLSERASRSGRSELLAAAALEAEDRARPQTRVNPAAAVPVPAPPPPPAPAPVAAPSPTPTATPKPASTPTAKATPKPTTAPAPAPKAAAAAPAAPAGVSQAACASGSAVEAGLTKDAIRVHRAVCALFSGVTGWGGTRGSGDFHGTGQALDIMIPNSSVGQSIANYVRANAKALGVSEVIWSQHIWTVQRSGEGWRAMSDRGSPTANHYDHVHVSVYGNSGTV